MVMNVLKAGVIFALLDVAGLQAQVRLPPACYAMDRAVYDREPPIPLVQEPALSDWPDRVGRALRLPGHSSIITLDSLLRRDSTAVLWALAYLAGDAVHTRYATLADKMAAVAAYRRISGRPGPILYILSRLHNDVSRPMAVQAIRRPVGAKAEGVLFAYACDALWLLSNWYADSAQATAAGGGNSPVMAAGALLPELYPLLSADHRAVVDSIVGSWGANADLDQLHYYVNHE